MNKKVDLAGQIGFVLAAAGSAVGVGNLWRFPYLAAKDGGGLFLIIYLVLVYSRFYIVNNRYCHWTKNRKKCHLCI